MAEEGVRPELVRRWKTRDTAIVVALVLALLLAVFVTVHVVGPERTAVEDAASESLTARDTANGDGAGDGSSSPGTSGNSASGPRSASHAPAGVRGHETARAGAGGRPAVGASARAAATSASEGPPPPGPSSAFGRFTVLGEVDAVGDRMLGERVAIDGDLAAATAWYRGSSGDRSEVRVFERCGGVWTEAQTIEPPPFAGGVARDVGVFRGRIAVVGWTASGSRTFVLRSYSRGGGGQWTVESETPLSDDRWSEDWTFGSALSTAVGRTGGALVPWKFANGAWTQIASPGTNLGTSHGSWMTAAGDTVACFSSASANRSLAFFRWKGDRLAADGLAGDWPNPGPTQAGALARDGAALVTTSGFVTIYERSAGGWARTLPTRLPAQVQGTTGSRGVAADGELAVVAAVAPARFVVLAHRRDGWYSVETRPPLRERRDDARFTDGASVAMSGRTVMCGTRWDRTTGGRVIFFDVTDDDLAQAEKVEPATR